MNNIALAFSGGGYRAACFSLGCLSYLDQLKFTEDGKEQTLLQQVRYISSTSGGSITNLLYASFLYQGKDFSQCYEYLTAQLDGERLIARALKILGSPAPWKERPAKSRNLINAFSIAYDEILAGQDFGLFAQNSHKVHLEEICVNATEFSNGTAFRFQSQGAGSGNGKIGNGYIYFTEDGMPAAARLKLADILASSSCFPSGFEPLIFPNDYTHAALSAEQLNDAISYTSNEFTLPETDEKKHNQFDPLANRSFQKGRCFGIMDGGVTDNQAIEAYKLADRRRSDHQQPGFGLFIACDVSSYFMDGYTLPQEKKKWYSRLTLNFGISAWIAGSLLLPVLLLLNSAWKPWMYVAGTISGLLLLPVLYRAWKKIKGWLGPKSPKDSWSTIFKKYKPVFFRLPLGALEQMIQSRLKSVFILANDIYLKQIRRQYYESLFGDERYRDRTIQNAIYDLSKAKFKPGTPERPLQPSAVMTEVAEMARTMGTTLWFDAAQQTRKMKECIIATGYFTTCYNLLKYLDKKSSHQALTDIEKQIRERLEKDWVILTGAPTAEQLLAACGC